MRTNLKFIQELLHDKKHVIMYLCETWLRDDDKYIFENLDLNIYAYEHKSSMTDQHQAGRPFGRMAWIFTKNLRDRIEIKFNSDAIASLRIKQQIIVLATYINSSNGQQEYDVGHQRVKNK